MKMGADYLNLDNITFIHFDQDDEGVATVKIESISGIFKQYQGAEVEACRKNLEALIAGSPPTGASLPGVAAETKS